MQMHLGLQAAVRSEAFRHLLSEKTHVLTPRGVSACKTIVLKDAWA